MDVRDELGRVRAPTLVIHCEGDQVAPVDDGRAFAAGIPSTTLRVLAGSEHVPTLTQPGEIAALIEEWHAGSLT